MKQRNALVIGHAGYQKTGKLLNSVNDANDMATALKDLGIDVMALLDLSGKMFILIQRLAEWWPESLAR